jgi:hypothetical protein
MLFLLAVLVCLLGCGQGSSIFLVPTDVSESSLTMLAAKHFRRTLLDLQLDDSLGEIVRVNASSDIERAVNSAKQGSEVVLLATLPSAQLLWPAVAQQCEPGSAGV